MQRTAWAALARIGSTAAFAAVIAPAERRSIEQSGLMPGLASCERP